MERRRVIALFCVLIIIVLALVLLLTHCGKSDTADAASTPEAEATVTPEASVTVITPPAETGSAYTPEPSPTAT
ncbi:MAG: hypothetical protein LUE21_11035, partial [Oscillospiraceae bacterium]|nr:hypothetical protein [Oscillospiraceae bacterium]